MKMSDFNKRLAAARSKAKKGKKKVRVDDEGDHEYRF